LRFLNNNVDKMPLLRKNSKIYRAYEALLKKKINNVSNNEDINAQDGKGNTKLHLASEIGNEISVQHLLKTPNINIEVKNNKNQKALDIVNNKILKNKNPDINYENIAKLIIDYREQNNLQENKLIIDNIILPVSELVTIKIKPQTDSVYKKTSIKRMGSFKGQASENLFKKQNNSQEIELTKDNITKTSQNNNDDAINAAMEELENIVKELSVIGDISS